MRSQMIFIGLVFILALTDPLGHTTQFTYVDDPTTGIAANKPTVVTRPDGSTLHFTYNSFGSVTSAIDENWNKTQLVTDDGGTCPAAGWAWPSTTR